MSLTLRPHDISIFRWMTESRSWRSHIPHQVTISPLSTATQSGGIFLLSSHSYHGFPVNPSRGERCVRDSPGGEFSTVRTMCRKQAEEAERKKQNWPEEEGNFDEELQRLTSPMAPWAWSQSVVLGGNKLQSPPPWQHWSSDTQRLD